MIILFQRVCDSCVAVNFTYIGPVFMNTYLFVPDSVQASTDLAPLFCFVRLRSLHQTEMYNFVDLRQ